MRQRKLTLTIEQASRAPQLGYRPHSSALSWSLSSLVSVTQSCTRPAPDTIIREVKEETGLEITAGEVLGERVHPKTRRHMVYVAARPARVRELDVSVGDPDELSEVKRVPLPDAEELLPGVFEPVHAHLERELH